MARTPNGPVKLENLARKVLGPAMTKFGFGSAAILSAWPEIVGAELAARTRPERVKWPRRRDEAGPGEPAVLVIRAEGADALEIQHTAPQILERINAVFGWGAIGRIAIHQAPVPEAPPADDVPPADTPASGDLADALERLGRRVAAEKDNSA